MKTIDFIVIAITFSVFFILRLVLKGESTRNHCGGDRACKNCSAAAECKKKESRAK